MPETIDSKVARTVARVRDQRRLMAALYEEDVVRAAIEQASDRIASAFSTHGEARRQHDIRVTRLSTWGES